MAMDFDSWKRDNPSAHHEDFVDHDDANFPSHHHASESSPSFKYDAVDAVVADVDADDDDFGPRTEMAVAAPDDGEYDASSNAAEFETYFDDPVVAVAVAVAASDAKEEEANDDDVIEHNPAEQEESQVVPASLDHLSRDELCRMIYRLDYERNALRERLRRAEPNGRGCPPPPGNDHVDENGGRKRRADEQVEVPARDRRARSRRDLPTASEVIVPPPSPLEVEAFRTRLGERVAAAVRASAVHGLRKVPRTVVAERAVGLPLALALMRDHECARTSDTRRMIKWTLIGDEDVAAVLGVEREVHPVRHDGTGRVALRGADPAGGYHRARWAGAEVRYDRREESLTVVARTKGSGGGRPEGRVEDRGGTEV